MTTSTSTSSTAAVRVSSQKRVSPSRAVQNIFTLAWRSLVQIRHDPSELLGLTVMPIVFVLMFAYIFGPAMMGSVSAYLPIVIPGILVQNALFATTTTGIGLNTDITKGVFDRFRSLPISRIAPLAGRVVADATKQVYSTAALLLVGFLIGFRVKTNIESVILAFLLLLVFTTLVMWAMIFVGLVVDSPEKVQTFELAIVFPLGFLSTVFIPISPGAPSWIAFVMRNSPVTHLVEAVRGLLLGGPVAAHVVLTLVWCVGLAAIFVPLCQRQFRSRV